MKIIYSFFLALFFSTSAFAAGHTVTASATAVTCFGMCNGSTMSAIGGGVGPFTYSWAPSGGTGSGASGLCAGSYTVTVTDNSDMSTATATIAVTSPTALNVTITGGGAVCTGGCTNLTANVTGGTPIYNYNWGPIPGTTPIYSACPSSGTTYTVTVSDVNGCVTSSSSMVAVTPTATVTVPPNATYCDGATVPAGIFSSTPGGATFVWTNSNTSIGLAASGITSVPSFTAMNTGSTPINSTITVTPTYAGCPGTPNSYTITVNPTPTITISPSTTVCAGACVSLSATTTPGPSTYMWIGPSAFVATIANPIICPAVAGTYTVTATYASCSANAITVVTVNGPIASGITSTNATGCGVCDGTASLSPSGGTPPYTPSWGSMTITGICPGTYVGTITDGVGCTITDSTTIYNSNDLIANFTMVPDSTNPYNFFCFNSSTGAGNSYAWDFADGVVSSLASPSHTYALPGTYNVCLIASNFLCGADTLCQDLAVTGVSSPCNALFNIADDTINPDPNAHYVYNLSYGATLTYLWDFGDGTTSTSATPSHVYSGTGPYLLCLSIDNGAGCTDMFCDSLISADSLNRSSGIMQLTVYDVPTFYSVATGITDAMESVNVTVAPNPFNETTLFTVNSTEIYSFELTDVLGKKVKSKTGISEKQFEISREGLENGIYFYKIYTSESVIGIGKVVIK